MATKQVQIEPMDLDRRLASLLGLMAEDDCRTVPQQIAWLIRMEAVRRDLLPNVAGEFQKEKRRELAAA